jgi:hypothetical protein
MAPAIANTGLVTGLQQNCSLCPSGHALNAQFTSGSGSESCLDYCVCREACCDDDDFINRIATLFQVSSVSGCSTMVDWCDFSDGDSTASFPAASVELMGFLNQFSELPLGANAAMVVSHCPVACSECSASDSC